MRSVEEMEAGIGLDVYGTLVDPLAIDERLRPFAGDAAAKLAQQWRAKQLEYTFRRAAMGQYVNFDLCTEQALQLVLDSAGVRVSREDRAYLLECYKGLDAYPDAIAGLRRLRAVGCELFAFSNGVEATLRHLLDHAGLLVYLDGIISVDEVRTFKPDPRVYALLSKRLNCPPAEIWMVSSNPFDVLGAKAAGLKAAWIKRNPRAVFDPWGIDPDCVVASVEEFAERFTRPQPA